MGLPPPRLRDLASWIQGENSSAETRPREVWEISVPAETSLSWSLVLSVLLSESDECFSDLLRKLTGYEAEEKEIREEKESTTSKPHPNVIKEELKSFNPFKNRHTFFNCKEVSEIVSTFGLHLDRYANKLRSRVDECNDDLQLKAASKLLACNIYVFFSDEIESRKFIPYPETPTFKRNIFLFQYKNQQHDKRKEPKYIFHFDMTVQRAHVLKIDALRHFLKEAKISPASIENVIQLMNNPDFHGRAFLPTILKSRYLDILPEIYKSPYIAFKLSEAGFETDPIAGLPEKSSALCYALCNGDLKYFRILYDYASNCRCLFDRSVRRADDTVLETLKRIKSVIENDLSQVSNCNFEESMELRRALHRLNQLNRFAEYQFGIASNLNHLKNKYQNRPESAAFELLKEIIVSILEHYLTFFYCESPKSENISQDFTDYLSFTDYYEYTDRFFFLSFFDNFYKLKVCFDLKEENMVLKVEWKMFLAMMSNKYFPKLVHENECKNEHSIMMENKNILRRIPLFHRTLLESAVKTFRDKLKIASNYDDSKGYLISEKLANRSFSSSQVIDELLISRLKEHIDAALAVSPSADGRRDVLAIEKAMQVLGESLKPPSSMNSIVSFLLRSCLPSSLQEVFIRIRNDLSKYRSNSIYGKLTVEGDSKIFEGIKEELKSIQEVFKVVYFTQECRIEEEVMDLSLTELKDSLDSDKYKAFQREYELHINRRKQEYKKYHRKCIQLLLDTILDLQDYSRKTSETQHIFGQLKSIEYLLMFIVRNKSEAYLQNLLRDVKNFIKIKLDKHNAEIMKMKNKNEQLQEMLKKDKTTLNDMKQQNPQFEELTYEQLKDLRDCLNSTLPEWCNRILDNNSKSEMLLSAPNIESFYKRLKKYTLLSEELEMINEAVENALKEATDAKSRLEDIFNNRLYGAEQNIDELLKRILIPSDKLTALRSCFQKRDTNEAMKYLKKRISEDSIKKGVKKMLKYAALGNGYANMLLTKITFQRHFDSNFYTTAILHGNICEKLEDNLTSKVNFLITRLKALKKILIEEDGEIQELWNCERSEANRYQLKFLMRQLYMTEKTVRASLEMAYFDCVNIFHGQPKKGANSTSSNALRYLYEKSTGLFEGIDLRNLVSHRTNIPETIGGILDENDFPSEMIEKMLELIDDKEAIEALFELFQLFVTLEEKDFIYRIENNMFVEHSKLMKVVKECTRWRDYLFLFPFIKSFRES